MFGAHTKLLSFSTPTVFLNSYGVFHTAKPDSDNPVTNTTVTSSLVGHCLQVDKSYTSETIQNPKRNKYEYIYICGCMSICVYIYIYVCIRTCKPTHIPTYPHTCIHACMHAYMHAYKHACSSTSAAFTGYSLSLGLVTPQFAFKFETTSG